MAGSELEPLLSREDLTGELRRPGPATLDSVYLSSIALVAHFRLDLPATPSTHHDLRDLKEQLMVLMRLLLMRLREHGVDCPAVALLSPRTSSAGAGESAQKDFLASYGALQADQDWHRGEFSIFVECSEDAATRRLKDVLAPQPPDVRLDRKAQTLEEVIERSAVRAEKNPLLRALNEAWKSESEQCENENVPGEEREARCKKRGLNAIDVRIDEALKQSVKLIEELR